MKYIESSTIELKREYTDEIRKEVIAFANTSGGTVYVGVADDGSIIGVENTDILIQRICNMLRDSVRPDITMFVSYDTIIENDLPIVAVSVQQGTGRPYYIGSKGLRPEGVYVRQGTTTAPASETAIRAMIRDTDGDSYEERRSITQELTFVEAAHHFKQGNLEFGESQMKTLGLISIDGIYTNLALLLSDQCPHIIKAATFESTDSMAFQDRREFGGSLLKQIDDAYEYLDMRNKTSSTFTGLYRNDRRDYPETALREALLNAVTHRDYSMSAGTLISVYADRIEIVSIGGLIKGVELEDVMIGISVCRNPKLANIFYRLRLIEAYGTGMKKIMSSYDASVCKPEFKVTANAFKISLPKIATYEETSVHDPNAEKVLRLLQSRNDAGRADIEKELGLSTATVSRALKNLLELGAVVRTGNGKNTRYQMRK